MLMPVEALMVTEDMLVRERVTLVELEAQGESVGAVGVGRAELLALSEALLAVGTAERDREAEAETLLQEDEEGVAPPRDAENGAEKQPEDDTVADRQSDIVVLVVKVAPPTPLPLAAALAQADGEAAFPV